MNDTVIVITSVTLGCPLSMWGTWLATHADRKLKARGYLIAAAGAAVLATGSALAGYPVTAALETGMGTYWLYMWWNNGGGDGMRRLFGRLRSLLTPPSPAPQAT